MTKTKTKTKLKVFPLIVPMGDIKAARKIYRYVKRKQEERGLKFISSYQISPRRINMYFKEEDNGVKLV